MDPEARAQRAANNKSLRIIKNELEALNERGFLSDEQFDTIISALPAEQSLNARSPLPTPQPTPQPIQNAVQAPPAQHIPTPQPQPQTDMHLHQHHAPPPTYGQSVPPPPPPSKAEVGHCTALWPYTTPDARDLHFQPGDHISITAFVNAEWWEGVNCRTNASGIFPANYVRQEQGPSPLAAAPQQTFGGQGDWKAYPGGGFPGQPPKHDPYANPVPPVAIAEGHAQQEGEHGKPGKSDKVQEMGKKFGGKLGNAAIFGAGATIGSNIVNSIF